MKILLFQLDGKIPNVALRGGLPEGGDLVIITKDNAMQSGRAAAVITFTVEVETGVMRRVQASVPVRALVAALRVLDAAHEDGFRKLLRPGGNGTVH